MTEQDKVEWQRIADSLARIEERAAAINWTSVQAAFVLARHEILAKLQQIELGYGNGKD